MSVNITVARMRSDGGRVAGAREELLDLLGVTVRCPRRRGCGPPPAARPAARRGCDPRGSEPASPDELLLAVKHQRRHADAGQEVPDVGLDDHASSVRVICGVAAERSKIPRPMRSRSLSALGANTRERAAFAPMLRHLEDALVFVDPTLPGRAVVRIEVRSRRCRRGSVRACAPGRWPRTGRSSPRPLTVRTVRRAPSRRRPSPRARRPCGLRAAPARRQGPTAPCHACRRGSAARTRRACSRKRAIRGSAH